MRNPAAEKTVYCGEPERRQKLNNDLNVGSIAPDFSVTDVDGKRVTLEMLRENGPVLLVLNRGFK